ncbi:hypothetical protein U9M48_005945, partial [Paspalum notatum var. saurae]
LRPRPGDDGTSTTQLAHPLIASAAAPHSIIEPPRHQVQAIRSLDQETTTPRSSSKARQRITVANVLPAFLRDSPWYSSSSSTAAPMVFLFLAKAQTRESRAEHERCRLVDLIRSSYLPHEDLKTREALGRAVVLRGKGAKRNELLRGALLGSKEDGSKERLVEVQPHVGEGGVDLILGSGLDGGADAGDLLLVGYGVSAAAL